MRNIAMGSNAMGIILTICCRHLVAGTTPNIYTTFLNNFNIHYRTNNPILSLLADANNS